MHTEKSPNHQTKATPILHNSEQPLPTKPSFLFIVSTSIGILILVLGAIVGYYGVAH